MTGRCGEAGWERRGEGWRDRGSWGRLVVPSVRLLRSVRVGRRGSVGVWVRCLGPGVAMRDFGTGTGTGTTGTCPRSDSRVTRRVICGADREGVITRDLRSHKICPRHPPRSATLKIHSYPPLAACPKFAAAFFLLSGALESNFFRVE